MDFSNHTTKLVHLLKGHACATCKLLVVQDINQFLATVADQAYDVVELQYLPFFRTVSPSPNLRGCITCGRAKLRSLTKMIFKAVKMKELTEFCFSYS